jgi:hypothetical protein
VADKKQKIMSLYNIDTIEYTRANLSIDYDNKSKIIELYDFFNYDNYIKPKIKNEEIIEIAYTYPNKIISIIDIYNDKILLKTKDDIISILYNSLKFNSAEIILKNLRTIETIIYNNKYLGIIEKWIKCIALYYFNNIYSLPISILLFREFNIRFTNYHCNIFNPLYKIYNQPINISFNNTGKEKFGNLVISVIINNVQLKYERLVQILHYSKPIEYDDKNEKITYNESGTEKTIVLNLNYSGVKNSTSINIINKASNSEDFTNLLTNNIPNLIQENLAKNIKISEELKTYLVDNNKKNIYPIQELLMGSGKSSVITPYTVLLLINHIIEKNQMDKSIYVVMPQTLIAQSFGTFMSNLFPLFNNIEIIIIINGSSPYKPMYKDSIKIYLIDDMNIKLLFFSLYQRNELSDHPVPRANFNNFKNDYFIYDEIDAMANPMSCELNIPETPETLDTKIIFEMSKLLYDKIFINDDFWSKFDKKYIGDNTYHKYIAILNKEIKDKVNEYFNTNIQTQFEEFKKNLTTVNIFIEYIRTNVLFYILTKQINYDYGIPNNYDECNICSGDYIYKAIPYIGGDAPAYGSSFSDPILSYILTYICYMKKTEINDTSVRCDYRDIDKKYIINFYDDREHEKILRNFFTIDFITYEYYSNNKNFYLNNMKASFDIVKDDFNKIFFSILDKQKEYNSKCSNISFTELLLSRNIKNFVGFTGTAYIDPPIDEKKDDIIIFNDSNYITRSKISGPKKTDGKSIDFDTVEKAIEHILTNPCITKKFNTNSKDKLIDDIFKCLSNYTVLIDIGALFINYSDSRFIEEYKKVTYRQDYIVYFDNGIKAYDIKNNRNVDISSLGQDNKIFFYFSNKHITGVDAKKYMKIDAHGLVTITNTTTMRDFSQGVFRMRNILDGTQSIDIVINNNLINQIGQEDCTEKKCNVTQNEETKNNNCNFENRTKLICHIDRHLNSEQKSVYESKRPLLLKQNIFALTKKVTDPIILYKSPLEIENNIYNEYYGDKPETKERNKTTGVDTIINKLNLIQNKESQGIVKTLYTEYITTNSNLLSAVINININEQKDTNKDTNKNTNKETNINLLLPGKINIPSLTNYNNHDNKIIIPNNINDLVKIIGNGNVFILYSKIYNQINILSVNELKIILFTNNYDFSNNNNVLININTSQYYGTLSDRINIIDIVTKSKLYLINYIKKYYEYLVAAPKLLSFLDLKKKEYDYYIKNEATIIKDLVAMNYTTNSKYLKYKTKYHNLKNKLKLWLHYTDKNE